MCDLLTKIEKRGNCLEGEDGGGFLQCEEVWRKLSRKGSSTGEDRILSSTDKTGTIGPVIKPLRKDPVQLSIWPGPVCIGPQI